MGLVLFSLAIRLPSIFIPHVENDEIIYQTLADKVSKDLSDYSLQGTPVLDNLPKRNYDYPIFHRPPLFVYTLAFFRSLLGQRLGMLLPILSGALLVPAVFFIGRLLYGEKKALLAGFILLSCPIILFGSTRVLIDILLTLLVALTVLVFKKAEDRQSFTWYILGGFIFGLTALTKESAFLILPVCFYVMFRKGVTAKKVFFAVSFGAVSFAVFSPWLYHFYKASGQFFPWWARIYEENLEMFPFVKMAVERPWYFYFGHLLVVSPVYIFGYLRLAERIKNRGDLTEPIWLLSYFIFATIFGLMGEGYQMRYIMPAVPALCLLSADYLAGKNKVIWIAGILLLAYGFFTGILNSLIFKPADLFSAFYFFKL